MKLSILAALHFYHDMDVMLTALFWNVFLPGSFGSIRRAFTEESIKDLQ